jgi:mono/diheme cytochrome c family protein
MSRFQAPFGNCASLIFPLPFGRMLGLAMVCLSLFACKVERRKTDAELGLNSQQAAGRRSYETYCERCHEPYSSSGKQGPSLQGVFKKPYLSISGLPANDERVGEIIRYGRSKMNGFGQVLNQQQVNDLLVYMHTL